jgi:hypothetical protein
MSEVSGVTQYAGAAMFGFLAVGAVALFSFLSVAHWLGLRTAERQSRDRFALMKAILEHPGDQADRVLTAWREQELRKTEKDRRERISGGVVCAAVGVALALMLAILTKGEDGAWSIGLIPLFVGVVLALFGIYEKTVVE